MTREADDEFLVRFTEFAMENPGPVIVLSLRPTTAFTVLSALQLALRHPGFQQPGTSHDTVEAVARAIAYSFPGKIREYAVQGFDLTKNTPSATEAGG